MPTQTIDINREQKHVQHDDDNGYGSIGKFIRRVHSFEDLLKKLRWERSAQQPEEISEDAVNVHHQIESRRRSRSPSDVFQMPVHYPRYSKADYESMPEWRLDILFEEYGLPATGDVEHKRRYAIAAFLWPDEYCE